MDAEKNKNFKKVLLITIIILIVVAILVFLYFKNKKPVAKGCYRRKLTERVAKHATGTSSLLISDILPGTTTALPAAGTTATLPTAGANTGMTANLPATATFSATLPVTTATLSTTLPVIDTKATLTNVSFGGQNIVTPGNNPTLEIKKIPVGKSLFEDNLYNRGFPIETGAVIPANPVNSNSPINPINPTPNTHNSVNPFPEPNCENNVCEVPYGLPQLLRCIDPLLDNGNYYLYTLKPTVRNKNLCDLLAEDFQPVGFVQLNAGINECGKPNAILPHIRNQIRIADKPLPLKFTPTGLGADFKACNSFTICLIVPDNCVHIRGDGTFFDAVGSPFEILKNGYIRNMNNNELVVVEPNGIIHTCKTKVATSFFYLPTCPDKK